MKNSLDIILWDDPRLSTVCSPLDNNEFGSELEEFGQQLLATMTQHNGYGLAAPQVGILKRVFVMTFPNQTKLSPVVVCNPQIDLQGEPTHEREGCLSLPKIFEQVTRARSATLKYQNPAGQHFETPLNDWDARVAQHEFDHLNGILFFDYKDKRNTYGARMSKQVSKQTLRRWEKSR